MLLTDTLLSTRRSVDTLLPALALELRTTDRTLRRAARQGLIRGSRVSPRKFDMPLAERLCLQENWQTLSRLRDALRTEPSVRAAVLFGSYARGDQHPGSDVDLLVVVRSGTRVRRLAERLQGRLEVTVQLAELAAARQAPILLEEILREGRVLVDREEIWPGLVEERSRVERAAGRERRRIDEQLEATFGSHGRAA